MDKNALVRVKQICGCKAKIIGGEVVCPATPGLINISPATWWRWVKQGKVPQPIKKEGSTFWRYSDVVGLTVVNGTFTTDLGG